MQRIEVEFEAPQQRNAGRDERQRDREHGLAVGLQRMVDAGQPRVAGRTRPRRRIGDAYQRGQHCQAGGQGDAQDADARDLPQFGHAAVRSGEEGEEAERRGRRREGERQRERARRRQQGRAGAGPDAPQFAEAHAELDAEIDAEPDEQDRERDGDQVQRTHHHEPQRGREREAAQHRDAQCQHERGRTHRAPQQHEHDRDGDAADERRPFLQRGELVVRQGHRPRQRDVRAVAPGQAQVGGGRADRVAGRGAGQQGGIVEDGTDFHEAGFGRRTVEGEIPPGQRGVSSGEDALDRGGAARQQRRHLRERDLARQQGRAQRDRQQVRDAPQRRVARERVEQGPCIDEARRQRADLVRVEVQQAVAAEEIGTRAEVHRAEQGGLTAQAVGQFAGRLRRELGRRGTDDGQRRVAPVRERGGDGGVAPGPWRIRVDQLADVRIDREMARDVKPGCKYQQRKRPQHRPWVAARQVDEPGNLVGQHGVFIRTDAVRVTV